MPKAATSIQTPPSVQSGLSRAAGSPGSPVDLERLLRSLGGRQALLAKLAGTFLDDYPRQLSELRRDLAAGLLPSAALLAHRMKGNLSILRAPAAAEAAASLEAELQNGDSSSASRALRLLEAELEQVSTALAPLLPD